MLESQLHNEQFRQRQMESLNESIRSQLIETQKQLASGDALPLPDGFTLIETDYLDQLITERDQMAAQLEILSPEKTLSKFHKKPPSEKKQMLPRVDKTKSEIVQKKVLLGRERIGQKGSKSHCRFPSAERPRKTPYVERNIGDTCDNIPERAERCDEDILKIFMKKKTDPSGSLGNFECLDEHNSI